jgi:type IV secretory pathway VirB9-like protein
MKIRNRVLLLRLLVRTLAALLLGFVAIMTSPPAVASDGARVVRYSKEDIVPVRAKVRFSTLIVLPENEEILDFTTGDKEFWIVNGAHNLCYVHPAGAGIRSNLNLITESGHVYSFLLTEISNEPSAEPDLKVFVEPKETSSVVGSPLKGFVRAGELDAYRKELESVRQSSEDRVRIAEVNAAAEVSRFRSEYAKRIRFDYRLHTRATRAPFHISAVYHDDAFTYVVCSGTERPALYELKDGKPSLVNFAVEGGVYIVPKVLDDAYLAVGKKKAGFSRVTK